MAESSATVTLSRLWALRIGIALVLIKSAESLRCRTDDGPSEAELKRVARTCMRKFGENAYNMQSSSQAQGRYSQRTNRNGYNNYPDYDDSDESSEGDDSEDGNYQQNNRYNYNGGGRGSGSANWGNGGNGSGHGGGYNDEDRFVNQRNRQRFNNHNKSNANGSGNGNGNNQWPQQNQRNQGGVATQNGRVNNNYNNNNNNNRNKSNTNTSNNNYNNSNNSSSDSACIVQCFFEEMNMLNNNNYPDRHKVLYILTKDMRDRELRNFYTDTIQECFRYLESQRRREKCQFSRDLISCMTEYAKGNCDDWNEFSMVFN